MYTQSSATPAPSAPYQGQAQVPGKVGGFASLFRISPSGLLLLALELALIIAVFWFGEGGLRIAAPVLGACVLALSWRLGLNSQQHSGVSEVISRASGERIDISAALTEEVENPDLQAYARMTERLRDMIIEFQQHSLSISLSSARSRLLAEQANSETSGQQDVSAQIFQASDETTVALQDISSRTSTITDMNTRNLDVARESGQQLNEARFQVQSINNAMGDFQGNIARLDQSSTQIQKILGTVQDFSEQTNMLALNAAIEAARAGEQGRGFAVVADEVRNLSVRVGEAASQINSLLGEMIKAMSGADQQAQSIMTQSATAGESVGTAADQFEGMVADFSQAHQDLLMVSSSLEELTATNTETHQHASEIRDRSLTISESMKDIFTQTDTLRDSTNLVLQALCRFRLGEGHLEMVTEKLFTRRDEIGQVLEELVAQGINVFDQQFKPVPNTNPQKHTVSWGDPYRKRIQPMLDQWDQGGKDGVIYMVPLDNNGYLAAARSVSSQPMTGDPKVDTARSTHQRFIVTGTELNNLRKCTYLAMGTFVLPGTDTVIIAMYVPVMVSGKRWGTLSAGIHPKALGQDS